MAGSIDQRTVNASYDEPERRWRTAVGRDAPNVREDLRQGPRATPFRDVTARDQETAHE